ncbi:MAG TPA: hypothetical protein PKC65_01175 [Pyrinomonadaceae bacterium]|mgnify:CR=1 FL=1|nr:hypothetical protein [Pyrinomonadaceae bacterium]
MLSTNSILRQGRFRVSQIVASNSSHTIYEAQDNLAAKPVLLCENAGLTLFGNANAKYRGNGILGIADRFDENGRAYLVTEPLMSSGPWDLGNDRLNSAEVAKLCERIRPIVDSVAQIRRQFPNAKLIEISPLYFRASLDGTLKLAFFERAQILGSSPSESPYLPLEAIWETLDFASQKAITADYDERSLALLDAAPDHRTDLYSIAAVFYNLLAGSAPRSAMERLIEIHDSGNDPLTAIDGLNPHVSKNVSDELMKMLSLKRELRDDSLEAALMQPAMPTSAPVVSRPVVELAAPVEPQMEEPQEVEAAAIEASDQPVEEPVPVEDPTPVEEAPHVESANEAAAPTPVEAARTFAPAANSDDFDDLLEIPFGPSGPAISAHTHEAAEDTVLQPDEVLAYAAESPAEVFAPAEESASEPEAAPAEFEIAYSNEVVEEPVAAAEEEPVAAAEEEPAFVSALEEPTATFSLSEEVIEEHPEPFIDEIAPKEAELVEEAAALTHSPADEPFGGVHTRVEANTVPAVESVPKIKTAETSFASVPDSFGSSEPEAKGIPTKFIGIGAVALIVLAIGVWMLSSMGGGQPAKTQTAPAAATVRAEPEAQPAADSQVPPAEQQQSVVENSPAAPERPVVESREAKPRPQIAEAKPAKPEQKPAAAATPAKAKKISVDDLINDN